MTDQPPLWLRATRAAANPEAPSPRREADDRRDKLKLVWTAPMRVPSDTLRQVVEVAYTADGWRVRTALGPTLVWKTLCVVPEVNAALRAAEVAIGDMEK